MYFVLDTDFRTVLSTEDSTVNKTDEAPRGAQIFVGSRDLNEVQEGTSIGRKSVAGKAEALGMAVRPAWLPRVSKVQRERGKVRETGRKTRTCRSRTKDLTSLVPGLLIKGTLFLFLSNSESTKEGKPVGWSFEPVC